MNKIEKKHKLKQLNRNAICSIVFRKWTSTLPAATNHPRSPHTQLLY